MPSTSISHTLSQSSHFLHETTNSSTSFSTWKLFIFYKKCITRFLTSCSLLAQTSSTYTSHLHSTSNYHSYNPPSTSPRDLLLTHTLLTSPWYFLRIHFLPLFLLLLKHTILTSSLHHFVAQVSLLSSSTSFQKLHIPCCCT